MSFSFRDKGRLSDRLRGKTCDEILKELRDHLHQDRNMSFESSPSWGGFTSGPAFSRAGFPFMDQDMMSRPDMRARFEDLANRHPEFAEHLRPTAWGAAPEGESHFFHPPASGSNLYRQRHTSGGSGSGSGTYSEDNAIPIPVIHEDSGGGEAGPSRSRTRKIPQYGMRNTVDLGESHKLNPADPNEDLRSQRSWSAPPDNRTQGEAPQPKRFVTRVEVNNSQSNPTAGVDNDSVNPASNSSPGKPPPFPKAGGPGPSSQSNSRSSNVRHIPIFVEGRDEPVLPKASDNHSYSSSRSSSGYGQPNVSYAYASAPPGSHSAAFASTHSSPSPGWGWSQGSAPHPQGNSPYPPGSVPHPHGGVPHPHGGVPHSHGGVPHSHGGVPHPQGGTPHPHGGVPHPQGSASHPQGGAHQEPKPEAPVHTPKQVLPKDPIAKVQAIQEEVNELKNVVEKFSGARNDKDYMYLDEMLTRNLIKLDDIETEGKENIRQARKEAIRSIQRCISILETRAPLPQESKTGEIPEEGVSTEMEANCADTIEEQASQNETNAGAEVNGVHMEVQQKVDAHNSSNPDPSTADNDTREMSESENPMEVTRDEQTDEKVGEILSSSDVENKSKLPEESSEVAELMEVATATEDIGESIGKEPSDLNKVEMEVCGDGKENENQIDIATDGTNVTCESCDAKTDPTNDIAKKEGDASSAVTEDTKVEKEISVVDEVANVTTDKVSTKIGEAATVVEVKSDGNEPPIAINTQNESGVTSKESEGAVEVGQQSTGDRKPNDIPPSEVSNKEVS